MRRSASTAFAHPAGEVRLHAGERERGDAGGDEGHDDDGERLEIVRGDPVVDRELGEVRRKQGDEREAEERHDGERRPGTVGPGQADEHAEPAPGLAP